MLHRDRYHGVFWLPRYYFIQFNRLTGMDEGRPVTFNIDIHQLLLFLFCDILCPNIFM